MQLWLMLMLLLGIHQTENIGSLCLDSGFADPGLSFVNQEAWLSSTYHIYKRAPNIFLLGFVLLLLCTCAVEEGFQLPPPRHHCPSAHPSSVRPSSSHPSSSSTSVSLATSASSVSSFRPRPRALTPLTGSQASMRWQLYLRRALSVLAFRMLVLMTVFESTRILVL